MKTNLVLLVILVCILISCDGLILGKEYWSIMIKNNSDKKIYIIDFSNYYNDKNNKFENLPMYPDTSLPTIKPSFIMATPEMSGYITFDEKFEKIYNALPSDKLSVFVFSKDTLDKYSWDEIQKNYKILKRYDMTYDEFERADWTINYP